MKKLLFFAFAALVLVACNGQKGPGELTGASLSKSTLELAEGQEYRLTVRTEPEGASFKATWSSDDEWVASVAENGTVSANAVGTATISAAIEGTDIVAKCQVTVKSVLETTVFDRAAI
ncbi:MAG: Ig-like domain-containing protein, partial [Paludibacteraceae bacterium]|nr:Ig-like domain-containing protein [Paludibacteraceae bacterium]